MNADVRLIDLTLGDLMAAIDERITAAMAASTAAADLPPYVKGLEGICRIYGCSHGTANAIKQSGKIDEAICQVSARTFVVDTRKALTLCPPKKCN